VASDTRLKIVFIDCGVSESETPQRIISRLEEAGLKVVRNPTTRPSEKYVLIRWGSPRHPDLDEGAKAVLNSAESIKTNLHKNVAHRKMLEAGVKAPLFWTTFSEAKRASRELGCDFLRRRKHHIQGRDIIRLKPTDNLPHNKRHGYYVQYLEKTAEFRLHIFGDECIGLAEKKPKENPNQTIWNFENGWDLQYINSEDREAQVPHYNEMVLEATKALKALKLDFGAVDLIMCNGKPFVLEANTSPKLYQTKRYSKNFKSWVGNQ
jgi:glutathione synthase/RimK-type ligase-like ATP-grasp enzyme